MITPQQIQQISSGDTWHIWFTCSNHSFDAQEPSLINLTTAWHSLGLPQSGRPVRSLGWHCIALSEQDEQSNYLPSILWRDQQGNHSQLSQSTSPLQSKHTQSIKQQLLQLWGMFNTTILGKLFLLESQQNILVCAHWMLILLKQREQKGLKSRTVSDDVNKTVVLSKRTWPLNSFSQHICNMLGKHLYCLLGTVFTTDSLLSFE